MTKNHLYLHHGIFLGFIFILIFAFSLTGGTLAFDKSSVLNELYSVDELQSEISISHLEEALKEVYTQLEPLETEPIIRVLLEEALDKVRIAGEMEIIGMIVPLITSGEQEFSKAEIGGPLKITPIRGFLKINGQPYRGQVVLKPTPKGLMVINYVKLEDYLYSVLPSEVASDWPMEVLKAQAIAARCYALTNNRGNQDFDLYDDDRSQIYYGMRRENSNTTAAVNATRGQVVMYGNEIVQTYFFASSGGQTANSEDVWGLALPYLRSVTDYDQSSPHFRWEVTYKPEELQKRLLTKGISVGVILDINPLIYDESGRVVKLKITGNSGEIFLTGTDFRFALGLKSTRFNVNKPTSSERIASIPDNVNMLQVNTTVHSSAMATLFHFTGSGWGHGVGLSQWGARTMALAGADYQKILTHYYQGVMLFHLYE